MFHKTEKCISGDGKIQFTKLHNEFHELHKKFVKLKLLCEFVEYAIIITRRAAEKAIAKIAFSVFFVGKNNYFIKRMRREKYAKTKLQEIVFTILMVFVMVYAMICYNIALNMGGMSNVVFLNAFHELIIMGTACVYS